MNSNPPKNTAVSDRRNWLKFSLRSLILLAAIGGPVVAWIYHRWFSDIYSGADYDSFVSVGVIDGDLDRAAHVTKLLDSQRIPNIVEGSVAYGISVPPELAKRTVEILTADSKTVGYYFSTEFP